VATKLNIDGEEWEYKSLTISEAVSKIGTWNATLPRVRDITAFAGMTVEKNDVTIFGGRIQEPTHSFSRNGSVNKVRGFDYSIKLTDYITPYSSIVDSDTDTTIDTILTNTPFTYTIEDTFGYEAPLVFIDTSLEMLTDVEVYTDTTIEYDVNTVEIPKTIVDDTLNYGGSSTGMKRTFFYDGDTKRFYVWQMDNATKDIYYSHSVDGVNWTTVDSTATGVGPAWLVAWFDDKIYLIYYDGANIDCWDGTIADATGVITWANQNDNVIADTIKFGLVFDDTKHLWIVTTGNDGSAYESTDDGATWTKKFTGTDDGVRPFCGVGHEIIAIGQKGTDGDMTAIVLDTVANDLEEWTWDRSAGTITFTAKITDENDVDWGDLAQNAEFKIYFTWADTGDGELYHTTNESGAWVTTLLSDSVTGGYVSISCDGDNGSYVGWSGGANGLFIWKLLSGVETQEQEITDYTTPVQISSPRGNLQDGEIGVFWAIIDTDTDDSTFMLTNPTGIKLIAGAASGSIRTETITASGPMQHWGSMTATGTQLEDTEWSILKAGDNSVLVDGQSYAFDMNEAGVPSTETSIKVFADVTDGDVLISSILVNEVLDVLSMELDYEEVYTALTKWQTLSATLS